MSEPFDMSDKVAIVSGAGARGEGIGNGRAAALLLARAGCRVIAVDRDLRLADRTVEMIRSEGGIAEAAEADATVYEDCEAVVGFACQTFGGVDLLDNNVGIGSTGTVVTESPKRWQAVMHVNIDSMVNMSRAAIPVMTERGGGAIVNVSSISALRPRGLTAYSTSKGAVMSLTQAMAVDHGEQGIRVNCVAPGPVYTPMVSGEGMSDERREDRKAASLLGIEGTGWDVGRAVRFLLSEESRYITGQILVVDGGVTLKGPSR
jgi:NAD(P)-dependent dehydrogenase (short-subunit alcohol dehydrogenase family)